MKSLEVTEKEFTINKLLEDAAAKHRDLESLDDLLVDARKVQSVFLLCVYRSILMCI